MVFRMKFVKVSWSTTVPATTSEQAVVQAARLLYEQQHLLVFWTESGHLSEGWEVKQGKIVAEISDFADKRDRERLAVDCLLTPSQLREKYKVDGEHPDHPRSHWHFDGSQGPVSGYWTWLQQLLHALNLFAKAPLRDS